MGLSQLRREHFAFVRNGIDWAIDDGRAVYRLLYRWRLLHAANPLPYSSERINRLALDHRIDLAYRNGGWSVSSHLLFLDYRLFR